MAARWLQELAEYQAEEIGNPAEFWNYKDVCSVRSFKQMYPVTLDVTIRMFVDVTCESSYMLQQHRTFSGNPSCQNIHHTKCILPVHAQSLHTLGRRFPEGGQPTGLQEGWA